MINIIPSFVLQVAYTEAIFLLNQNASNRNVKITANHAWDLTIQSLSSFPPINLQFSRTLSEILTHTLSFNCFDLPGTPHPLVVPGSLFSCFNPIKTPPRPTQKATGEFLSHLWGATWEPSKLYLGLLWRTNEQISFEKPTCWVLISCHFSVSSTANKVNLILLWITKVDFQKGIRLLLINRWWNSLPTVEPWAAFTHHSGPGGRLAHTCSLDGSMQSWLKFIALHVSRSYFNKLTFGREHDTLNDSLSWTVGSPGHNHQSFYEQRPLDRLKHIS